MTQAKTKTGLFAKLLEAQAAAQAVEKKGRNQDQGYSYAQASDVIEEAQRALHVAGLVGYMVPGEIVEREVESQRGSAGIFATVTSTLIVVDPDDPTTTLEIPVKGTGVDYPGDKAVYKAMTGAAKYAYASALGIPFGDDPEADTAQAGQERKTRRSGEATPNQKRAITRKLNQAGVSRDLQAALVHAIGGDPLTFDGASAILDVIAPASDAELPAAVDALFEDAGEEVQAARTKAANDLPVDPPSPAEEPDAPTGEDGEPLFPTPEEAGEGEEPSDG